jgi:hypothetical protein
MRNLNTRNFPQERERERKRERREAEREREREITKERWLPKLRYCDWKYI